MNNLIYSTKIVDVVTYIKEIDYQDFTRMRKQIFQNSKKILEEIIILLKKIVNLMWYERKIN